MGHEIKKYLLDILNAVNEIESFLSEKPKDFLVYQKDLKTKRAVERNLEIIGEAVSKILSSNKSVNLSGARKIIDTRNRIIHGYDSVSDDIIWSIIIKHLPVLKSEVEKILNE